MIILYSGETTCKASKEIAKDQEVIYGSSIPLNRGFGRRIDLLLSTRDIEISTNEWKKKKVSKETCYVQQAKNIRMNKAILSKLIQLPLASKNMHVLALDCVGKLIPYFYLAHKYTNIYQYDKARLII